MVRRILLPLDSSPYTDAALEMSCHIAKATGAEIKGLAVLDIPGIERSVGSVPLGGIYYADRIIEAKKVEAVEHVTKLLEKFKEKCRQKEVSYRISEQQGSPSSVIIDKSIYFDLVVAGMRTFYQHEPDEVGISIEKVLGSTVTPIMAVPKGFTAPDHKVKVVLAFDASQPAARAMHRFAQLVDTAQFEVKIIRAGGEKPDADYCLTRAKYFLEAHGFEDVQTEWTPLNPIDAIKEKYLDWAEAFVLGVHSKHGLLDFMVGSLSRFLMAEGRKIVLLGQ